MFHGFPFIPQGFRTKVMRSAYDQGFDIGWRKQKFKQYYTRSDACRAFTQGFEDGANEAMEEIEKILSEPSMLEQILCPK